MYYSNDIAKKIKILSKQKGIKLNDMFESIGLGRNTMANLKTSMPKADNLAKIADYLNCSVDFLLGRTENPFLDDKTIMAVNLKEDLEAEVPKRILPFYRTAASAGIGSYLFDEVPVEYVTVSKTDKTTAADYILEVRGDSMEPKFYDGDCVLIQQSERIYEGQIGIFILNGESYIKKMGSGELISLNPAYVPIKLHEYDDIRCAGRVLGTIELE